MKYNLRIQYSEELGIITLDAVSENQQWRELTIKKGEPHYESLLAIYKLNPYV